MRILLLSFVFPPCQVIGALRVGKTAKYLHRFGHELRVVTAAEPPYPTGAPVEIPPAHVRYTPWWDVDAPYQRVIGGTAALRRRLRGARRGGAGTWMETAHARVNSPGAASRPAVGLAERVRLAYRDLVHVPDAAIGWYRSALREARRVAREFRPDVILASGLPVTALMVAHRLSRDTGVPWVGELRDLWADNHYNETSRLRHAVDQRLERRTLRTAAALVTVSEPLAETLRAKYDAPVAVVLNGFDEEDVPAAAPPPAQPDALELVYTGTILPHRDPTALFAAMERLGDDARAVRVVFQGASAREVQEHVLALATRHGVREQVSFAGRVPHAEAVRRQQSADVLLLLTWNDPRELGVYTGKLFEYIGARRPILSVGLADGVAAALVRERALGFASDDAEAIAGQLACWLAEKRTHGAVAAPAAGRIDDLTREAQTRTLEAVLLTAARGAAHSSPS